MSDAQTDVLLLASEAAADWPALGLGSAAPRRRARRVMSAQLLSDAVNLLDILIVWGAGVSSYELYLMVRAGEMGADHGQYVLGETLAAVLFAALGRQQHAYQLAWLTDLARQLSTVTKNLLLTLAMLTVACFLLKISDSFSRGWALLWLALAAAGLALGRAGVAVGVRHLIRRGHLRRRRAVIGEGTALGQLLDVLRGGGEEPVELVGIFTYDAAASSGGGEGGRSGIDGLLATLRALPLDEIIIACTEKDSHGLKPLIDRLRVLPVDIRLILPAFARQLPVRGTGMIGALPIIDVAVRPLKHWHVLIKALFDQTLALLLLVLLAPLLLAIAVLIKLDSRGPVFFIQERFGLNNKVIRVIKFRTMYVEQADPSGALQTVRGDARITRIGRRLRAHSLDELPQLLNVLRGEMSLVGPRPHALAMKAGDRLYHEAVSEYFARHRVKPGITGWAQVNGLRGETISLERAQQRVDYDIHYIDNWSIWFDLRILFMTVQVMFGSEHAF